MNRLDVRNVLLAATASILLMTASPMVGFAAQADELELRPIENTPEPLTQLHPKLTWMREQKVRSIWVGDDLFGMSADGDKTKAQVIADAGFNLVMVDMGPNTNDARSGAIDMGKPVAVKYDRTKSTDLDTRMAPNVAEAHRVGLAFYVGWKYGTHHLEPYRKYRSPTKGLATYSCCPLDEAYIGGQHIGDWAVKIAEGGADGINIDVEMYHSDTQSYYSPCVCDDCFGTYLKEFATDWQTFFETVPADERGQWLVDRGALDNLSNNWWGGSHYATFAAKRVERVWDGIRRRCQAVNPAFVLARYGVFDDLPGMERGMGSSSVPCPVFNGNEYHHGPYRGSYGNMQRIAGNLPVLYLSGIYVKSQPPEMLTQSALQASLYTDGWWAWYGSALLQDNLPGDYGRFAATSRRDYLDGITAVHAKIDKLLALPRSQWPKRLDGKLNWLRARVDKAEVKAAQTPSATALDALGEARTDLANYAKSAR
jgi:hypothetical protein